MRKKVRDSLVRIIHDDIFRGKIDAGDRLSSIEEPGRMNGMSVVFVREAIRKLSLIGRVRVRQGEGTFLARNIPSIPDILDARKYVEMATCLLAGRNATGKEHAELGARIYPHHHPMRKGGAPSVAFIGGGPYEVPFLRGAGNAK